MKVIARIIAVTMMVLSLAACQFHLQGQRELPKKLNTLYLESARYSDLSRKLRTRLMAAGATLTNSANTAPIILRILADDRDQRATTVGANQQSREYALTYTVRFELLLPDGHIILPPQTAFAERSIVLQANQILGATTQQDDLYNNMQLEVINQIMDRLGSPVVKEALDTIPSSPVIASEARQSIQ